MSFVYCVHSVNNISVFQLPSVRSINSKHRRPMSIEHITQTGYKRYDEFFLQRLIKNTTV